ncbi:hypothetical protein [Streptomyces sp. NPDC053079]|uniref:MmyB family transcriptional regulator n=1 Tax=Streptomyces sp. NPDC053079 TaxID=3365697 RepID=UPI0037D882DF
MSWTRSRAHRPRSSTTSAPSSYKTPWPWPLLGPLAGLPGREGNGAWAWFTRPEVCGSYLEEDHEAIGRVIVADLRAAVYRHCRRAARQALVDELLKRRLEFAAMWELGEVTLVRSTRKTLLHPRAGRLDLQGDAVLSPNTGNRLFLYRPQPGTDAAERLTFLHGVDNETFTS